MMNFITGDGKFVNGDILKSIAKQEITLIRFLARAYCISDGVSGLRSLTLSTNRSSLDLHIQEMKKGGLIHVSNQLCL